MLKSARFIQLFTLIGGSSLLLMTACATTTVQNDLTRLLTTKQCLQCELSQVDFTKVDLYGQKQKPLLLKLADPLTKKPIPAPFTRAEPQGPYLARTNLRGSRLSGGSGAQLARADFYRSNLAEVNLYKADLSRANLSYTDLSQAILYHANLEEVNLEGAVLHKAVLIGANLKNAEISNTNFKDADLSGATWVNGQYCQQGSIGKCLP